LSLENPARIVVVGGGPSGAFFSINLLRHARSLNREIEVQIIEKKKELQFYEIAQLFSFREGCNYCAGGISPRMMDVLEKEGLQIPEEILQGNVSSLTVQGGWKNVEMKVPEGRKMTLVYRGSKPKGRSCKYLNFDTFLMDSAIEEGAEVINGEAYEVGHSEAGKPWIDYKFITGSEERCRLLEADFLVFAAGVNQVVGRKVENNPLVGSLMRSVPGYKPPEVRRTLIFELEVSKEFIDSVKGEVYFAEFGPKDMKIDMFSLVPKEKYITVVLIGPTIDRSHPSENMDIINRFLELQQIRNILPRKVLRSPVCACNPNMTVGVARNPIGHRMAMVGDMAVSRLYKDGIFSAYLTSSALADCIIEKGIDKKSLRKGYWPAVRRIHYDNLFGKHLFNVNRISFSHPVLSRMVYQSILTERKVKPENRRRLADIIWKIVSGDDSYRNIWIARFHPAVILRILVGGVFVTIRNYLTELLFGLKWRGFGRYPTGVYKEVLERKRGEFIDLLGLQQLAVPQDFEKMYSIRIRSRKAKILHQLGRFGDEDKEYFKPKIIKVKRVSGDSNEVGSVIQYSTPLRWFTFRIILEDMVSDRFMIYRVMDGFARGGVLIFDIEETRKRLHLLSIYVAFNFPKGGGPLKKIYWRLFKLFFPGFTHDVLWNHSLCKLRDVVESDPGTGAAYP
jgi:flavin-dependent dehydrogenase